MSVQMSGLHESIHMRIRVTRGIKKTAEYARIGSRGSPEVNRRMRMNQSEGRKTKNGYDARAQNRVHSLVKAVNSRKFMRRKPMEHKTKRLRCMVFVSGFGLRIRNTRMKNMIRRRTGAVKRNTR
jgi:hypothetical protein